MIKTICPWCESTAEPILTAENASDAFFCYPSGDRAKDVRRNPLMCPECFGVGGYEDFEVREQVNTDPPDIEAWEAR